MPRPYNKTPETFHNNLDNLFDSIYFNVGYKYAVYIHIYIYITLNNNKVKKYIICFNV